MVDVIGVEGQLSLVDGIQQPFLLPLLSLRKDTVNATLHHPFHFLPHSLELVVSFYQRLCFGDAEMATFVSPSDHLGLHRLRHDQ